MLARSKPVPGTTLRSPSFANGTRSWVDQCLKMSDDPWTSGVLPRKDVELISLAVNAACTNLSAEGTRRHIRGALEAGATREEILMVLKIASLLSIHTCSLGAPILLEEAKAAGVKPTPKGPAATPVCDKMKAAGQWNTAWDAFFEIDPAWTEAIIAASLPVYTSGVFTPKLAELLSIAVDASITHMYAPGTRRHIQIGAEARRDDGGDHGSAQDLRRRRVCRRAISASRFWPRSFNALKEGNSGRTWLNSLRWPASTSSRRGEAQSSRSRTRTWPCSTSRGPSTRWRMPAFITDNRWDRVRSTAALSPAALMAGATT